MSEFLGSGGDLELWHSVQRLSRILVDVAAELRRANQKGASTYLLEYLRSDKPLSHVDRQDLADLLGGVSSREPGRRENVVVKRRRATMADDFSKIRQHGGTPQQAWTFLAAREVEKLGYDAFKYFGFKQKTANAVEDLASQFAEWNRRPSKRK